MAMVSLTMTLSFQIIEILLLSHVAMVHLSQLISLPFQFHVAI